jgi:hypothetical protein
MTGSPLAPIVIPIVVTIGLATWLIMVYYAGSHPQWGHSPARRHAVPRPAALADRRQPARRPARQAVTALPGPARPGTPTTTRCGLTAPAQRGTQLTAGAAWQPDMPTASLRRPPRGQLTHGEVTETEAARC